MAGPAGMNVTGGGPAGYSAPSPTFAKATPGKTGNANLGGLLSSLMGMGANKKLSGIYQENLDYQKKIMDEAYERSLPKGVDLQAK